MLAEKVGQTIALVVHGGVLDSLFRYVTALKLDYPRCFTIINSSIGIIRHGLFYGTHRWVIDTWGDVAHLDGAGAIWDWGEVAGLQLQPEFPAAGRHRMSPGKGREDDGYRNFFA